MVVLIAGSIEVDSFGAQIPVDRVGQSIEVEIVIAMGDLRSGIAIGTAERFDIRDRFGARRFAYRDRWRGAHGKRFGVTAADVVTGNSRRACGAVCRSIPAEVNPLGVGYIVVASVSHIAVGIDRFDRAS